MGRLIYYVATSIDGYISGPNGDISEFTQGGDGVDEYLRDLKGFKTVLMGRNTYEFGYQYGLIPGQPAYGHMDHYIFSNSLKIDDLSPQVYIEKIDISRVKEIKQSTEEDIYLCGGGQFAGWLLENGLVDVLKVKLNPIILGEGVSLFGASSAKARWTLEHTKTYDQGLVILTYRRQS